MNPTKRSELRRIADRGSQKPHEREVLLKRLTAPRAENKGLGMPHADVAAVLQDGFQLQVNRSTLCRAVDRVARRGEATWHALRDAARRSMVNGIDETGWNVATQLRWLWVAVSAQVTFCDILPGRGFPQAASILGADYEGWLTHDGWRTYYEFLRAGHQSCLQHLLRRCEDLLKVASPVAASFPRKVQAVLQQALTLRDRYHNHEISLHGLWTRPDVWRPSWIGCWPTPVGMRSTVGSPSICSMSDPTSSPFFIVPGWTPPTMSASELSAL